MANTNTNANAADEQVVLVDARVDCSPMGTNRTRLTVAVAVSESATHGLSVKADSFTQGVESWTMRFYHGHVRDLLELAPGERSEEWTSGYEGEYRLDVYLQAPLSLVKRVVAGYEEVWDGRNMVAEWSDDAEAALEELADLLRIDDVWED
jgi:hypothetical protein